MATGRSTRPWTDEVHLPKREAFTSSEEFYSTAFHELVHSTGHRERLNRKTLTDGTPFGSPTYTREELVAEMGAAFLCAEAGIERSHHRQLRRLHCGLAELSQVRSEGPWWSQALKRKKRADHVLGWGWTRRGRGRR